MYQNFLIHSSTNGHLGFFHVLAIVISAAMNTGVHVSFSILVSSGYMPSSGIAGLYGSLYYSAVKSNIFKSVLMRWINLEPIIHSAVIQKEKDKCRILMHIYGI